jgi:hypothetical protein
MSSSDSNSADKSSSSLSSSWSSSLSHWWIDLHDEQRLERLQQCRQLETVLEACRNRKGTAPKEGESQIERTVPGLRMMKYFGWRGLTINKDEENNTTTRNTEAEQVLAATCAREQHALWACRAVSIGCGQKLGVLKDCFEGEGAVPVLSHSQTNYEGQEAASQNSEMQIPCKQLQRDLGECVSQGANELYQRQRQRQKADKVLS